MFNTPPETHPSLQWDEETKVLTAAPVEKISLVEAKLLDLWNDAHPNHIGEYPFHRLPYAAAEFDAHFVWQASPGYEHELFRFLSRHKALNLAPLSVSIRPMNILTFNGAEPVRLTAIHAVAENAPRNSIGMSGRETNPTEVTRHQTSRSGVKRKKRKSAKNARKHNRNK